MTEKRLITAEDVYNMVSVEDPRVSPDGAWIAFVRVKPDRMENGYNRTIWLCSTQGDEPYQLTRGGKESSPRWSPDGKMLGFIAVRDGKPQVYALPVIAPGGEARALTSMSNGVAGFNWSPDGARIAFLSAINADEREKEDRGEIDEPPRDKLEAKHRSERREDEEKHRLDPYPVWRIPYRAGTSFLGDRFAQVYVAPIAEGLKPEDARPRRLTHAQANHDIPVWSPDGAYIYTARQVDVNQDEPYRHSALYRVRVEDGASEQLTDEAHTSFVADVSPDGRWLAFVRFPQERMAEKLTRLTVIPTVGGTPRDLNLTLDQSVLSAAWTADSRSLIFNGQWRGNCPIHRVDVESGQVTTLLAQTMKITTVDAGPDGGVAFAASTPETLTELYWLPAGSSEPVRLTNFNQMFLDEVIVQPTHEMVFASPGGEIQGWYILPSGYQEGEKYPLALNIHGGPHIMWGPGEASMFHEWQFHAARGYVVFYCNPRGADGYGQQFIEALHAAWGEVAYEDIMAGVDALIAKGFIDTDRMAITGGSYGGYMTGWIIGHTDRFHAAVSQRGVYNLLSFFGTSDIPSFIPGEFDVNPWENHELLWFHSPLAYAHKIKTPLLIIHSENDYRVPIEQGEQMFAYVRRSGGTVQMVRFPREGHELSRTGEPQHRIERLTRMIEWFDKYCMPEKA